MNNFILNTFLAGWCADAIGARLEFRQQRFTLSEVRDAIQFKGKNFSGVHPGQYTDDSEMEICLLMGLIDGKQEEYFPIEHIAKRYIHWFKSEPFDIGLTTTDALTDSTNAEDMINNAYIFNEDSESNGSLMRCIPIAVYGIGKPIEIILDMASSDASLTHYSKNVHLITGLYCFIISQILEHRLAGKTINILNLLQSSEHIISTNDNILNWFREAKSLSSLAVYNSIINVGHVKHAFIFVIYFLNNIHNFTYESALEAVLMCGGDTDTNAKIVGNLFGAFYSDCIPQAVLNRVLNFDCTYPDDFFKRPKIYGINHALKLVNTIKNR